MKKQISLILITAVLIVFSCKKKETAAPNTTSSTTGSTTGNPSIQPNGSGTTNYDIVFEVITNYSKYNGSFLPAYSNVCALYSAITVTNEVHLNLSDMGIVKLNGTTFANHFGTNNYYYYDSTNSNFVAPYLWTATGASSINAMSFTNNTPFPVFSNYTSLPDSISKSNGFTISFTGLSGCDFVQVQIIGPTGSQYLAPKLVAGNASGVTFNASELTAMNTGDGGYFFIKFIKDNIQTVNGKMVNVRSGICYSNVNFKIKP